MLACGSPAASPDAAPDAPAAGCPLPPGQAYFMSRLNLAPFPAGFDFNGDSQPDNEIGKMPAAAIGSVNAGFDGAIASGEQIVLLHINQWSDPPTPTDPDLEAWMLTGRDADVPVDPSNNPEPGSLFFANPTQFDLDCQPETRTSAASLDGGSLVADGEDWLFPLSSTGATRFRSLHFEATMDGELVTIDGVLGATVPLCSLAAIPMPGELPGSVLDVLINEPLIEQATTTDIDLDGDGLELVEGDGQGILRCFDGDGTIIDGPTCVCHPDIADAYSVAFSVRFVIATIVAVLP